MKDELRFALLDIDSVIGNLQEAEDFAPYAAAKEIEDLIETLCDVEEAIAGLYDEACLGESLEDE